MNAMRTPKKGHGTALSVVISIPSNTGKSENSPLPGGLKLRKRCKTSADDVRANEAVNDVEVVLR